MRRGVLVLVVSLLAVLPQSMLQAYTDYSPLGWVSRVVNPQAYSSFVLVVGIIGVAINPVMLFALMYVIGRVLNLRRDYPVVVYCLFLGALIGGLAGRTVVYYAHPANGSDLAVMASIAFDSVASAVSAIFVGFTAAALASVRRPQAPDDDSPRARQG